MNAHKTFAGASSHDQKHVVSGEDLQTRENEELRNAAWMREMREACTQLIASSWPGLKFDKRKHSRNIDCSVGDQGNPCASPHSRSAPILEETASLQTAMVKNQEWGENALFGCKITDAFKNMAVY
jgi:hypothetical protein